MEKWWFNSMMFNRGLEYRCGLSKLIDSFGPIENNSVNEDPSILTDSENSSYSHGDYLVDVRNIRNCLSDKTFLVSNSNRNSYSIYYGIENQILEIDNNHSFLNEPESFVYSYKNSSYLKNGSKSNDHNDRYDTKYNWNNTLNSYIESYLRSEMRIESYLRSSIDNSIFDPRKKYHYNYNYNSSDKLYNYSDKYNDSNDSDFTKIESSNDLDETPKTRQDYSHLWVRCDNEDCLLLNYKSALKSNKNICQYYGSHLKMSSSDRIELLIDPGTWNPMDEDMVSVDPIEFDSDPTKDIQDIVKYIDEITTRLVIYYALLPDYDTEDESDTEDEFDSEQILNQVNIYLSPLKK